MKIRHSLLLKFWKRSDKGDGVVPNYPEVDPHEVEYSFQALNLMIHGLDCLSFVFYLFCLI